MSNPDDEIPKIRDLVVVAGTPALAVSRVKEYYPHLSREDLEDVVQEEFLKLFMEAPVPLRNSQSASIAWHRLNDAYHVAWKEQNHRGMLIAQQEIESLLRSVH